MKKNQIKNIIIMIVIALFINIVSTYANNYLFNSNEVSYNNNSSGIESDNVQGAIDKLYEEATNYSDMRKLIYPVGSIYISVEDDTVAKVEARYGGTWEVFGAGRTIIGVNTSETEFNTIEKTGGEKTHKLTIAEMPNHNHTFTNTSGNSWKQASGYGSVTATASTGANRANIGGISGSISSTGGDGAHNNLQPYITVYMYKRTA